MRWQPFAVCINWKTSFEKVRHASSVTSLASHTSSVCKPLCGHLVAMAADCSVDACSEWWYGRGSSWRLMSNAALVGDSWTSRAVAIYSRRRGCYSTSYSLASLSRATRYVYDCLCWRTKLLCTSERGYSILSYHWTVHAVNNLHVSLSRAAIICKKHVNLNYVFLARRREREMIYREDDTLGLYIRHRK